MNLDSKNTIIFLCAILIIIIGFSYFLFLNNQASIGVKDSQTAKLESVSSSDDTDAIERELMETDFSLIDQELDGIEKEL